MNTASSSSTVPLFVDDGGPLQGVPIVLLHSAGGNSGHFAEQIVHLRRTRRAIAVDLRGHGRSPKAPCYAVELAAADVAEALTALDLERFVLVGHSWGGAVAVALVGQLKSQVAGLLLLDPASDGRCMPKEIADGLMQSLAYDYVTVVYAYWASMLKEARPEVRERLMREIVAVPREVVVGTLASLLIFDPVSILTQFRGPMRSVITATNDRPDAYHRLVDGLAVTRIEGTGHWLMLDKPDRVNEVIDAFVAEVTGGSI